MPAASLPPCSPSCSCSNGPAPVLLPWWPTTPGGGCAHLVQHEVVDVIDREGATVDHVKHAARRANDKLDAGAQLVHVLTHVGPANASLPRRGEALSVDGAGSTLAGAHRRQSQCQCDQPGMRAGTHHGRHPKVVTDGHHDLHDLRRQLARGREDQCLAVAVVEVDVLQQPCRAQGRTRSSSAVTAKGMRRYAQYAAPWRR